MAGKMTMEEMQAQLEALKAENQKLQNKRYGGDVRFKVSQKGAVSVYGLSARFPTTLYKGQWERLLDNVDDLKKFLKDNDHLLATKENPKKTEPAE